LAPTRLHIVRKQTRHRDRTVGIPADVSIGEYIRYKHGRNFDVDFITPEEITAERLKANDINFLIIYDLLEAFHTDKSRQIYERLKDVLRKADNIFPNLEFQEFVYSKLLYYNYFQQKGLPICPTITISKEEWDTQVAKQGGYKAVCDMVLQEIDRKGFKWFIVKPVYGQEAKGTMVFGRRDMLMSGFRKHLRETIEAYPGLIIQEYIENFGDSEKCPEIRFYFVGREYQYACVGMITKMYTLREDDGGATGASPAGKRSGWFDLPPNIDLKKMKSIAMRAMDTMPPISLKRGARQNVALPNLLTRVDMGCIRGGIFDPWINEIEFVPSLYIEDHDCPIDARMGEQMVDIAKQYLNLPSGRGLASKRVGRALTSGKSTKSRKKITGPRKLKIKRVLSVPWSAKASKKRQVAMRA